MPRRNSQAPTTLAAEEKFKRDAALAEAKFERDGKKKKTKIRTKTVTTPVVEEEVKDDTPFKKSYHTNHTDVFKSYIVNQEQYDLHTLYKKLYKGKTPEKVSGYHASSIIFRAMNDFERKCSFYLRTTKHSMKKEIKQTICDDLDKLKEVIMEM